MQIPFVTYVSFLGWHDGSFAKVWQEINYLKAEKLLQINKVGHESVEIPVPETNIAEVTNITTIGNMHGNKDSACKSETVQFLGCQTGRIANVVKEISDIDIKLDDLDLVDTGLHLPSTSSITLVQNQLIDLNKVIQKKDDGVAINNFYTLVPYSDSDDPPSSLKSQCEITGSEDIEFQFNSRITTEQYLTPDMDYSDEDSCGSERDVRSSTQNKTNDEFEPNWSSDSDCSELTDNEPAVRRKSSSESDSGVERSKKLPTKKNNL